MPSPSYASGPADTPLIGATIGEALERAAEHFADHDALVDVPTGRRRTYREFDEAVTGLATGLLERRVGKGDRVAACGRAAPP